MQSLILILIIIEAIRLPVTGVLDGRTITIIQEPVTAIMEIAPIVVVLTAETLAATTVLQLH